MKTKSNGLDQMLPSGKLFRRESDTSLDRSMVSSDFEDMKKKVTNFQQEIFKLQAANSDLTQVNKRWHRYNTDMQVFIDKLQTTIRDQQEQLNKIGESNLFSTQNENECCRSECRRLREEVKKLKEDNSHLIHQIKAHKDDWEAEKNEKQQIIKERDCLQQRLNEILREMRSEGTAVNDIKNRTYGCCNSWAKGLEHIHGRPISHDSNIVCDGCYNAGDSSGEEELRGLDRSPDDGTCFSRSVTESYMSLPPFETSPTSSTNSVPSDHQTFAMGIKSHGATVTSYVQMPVVKSSSAPDRRSALKPPKFVNSISLSVLGSNPPSPMVKPDKSRSAPASQRRGGVDSSTQHRAEDVSQPSSSPLPFTDNPSTDPSASSFNVDLRNCPHCQLAFPPKSYIEFMDHCESCHKLS